MQLLAENRIAPDHTPTAAFSSRRVVDQTKAPRRRRREKIESGPTPCPLCGYSLVARIGMLGPYFYCLCAPSSRGAGLLPARDGN